MLDLVSFQNRIVMTSLLCSLPQERDINLTDPDSEGGARREWPTRFFPPIGPAEMMDVYHWSDEDDVRSPPNALPPLNPWMVQPEVEMEEDSGESEREEEEDAVEQLLTP